MRISKSRPNEGLVSKLTTSLERLELPSAPRKMRALLRARLYRSGRVPLIGLSCSFLAVVWTDGMVSNFIQGNAQRIYLQFSQPTVNGWHSIESGRFRSINETLTSPTLKAIFFAAIWTAFQWLPPVLAYHTALGHRWSLSRKTRIWKRYGVLDSIARGVTACGDVMGASPARRPGAQRHLAKQISLIEDSILKIHRNSGQLPFRSHRRRELRKHAQLVVSQLRNAESRIDADGDVALTPLASLLMKIGTRAMEGRIGALLDKEDFEPDLRPVRDWEPLRLAAAAVLIAGCAVGVSLLSVPDDVTPYVIGGCGVAILALLYGRRAHNFLGLLDAIRGA
ncbi:hypothetical protein ABZ379_37065 [Streptomyces canus]|uniref:hypothetical protein n=1 Tax=Streptomyces canus TaxID=58343 RepID=UPI0033E515DC